MRGNGGGMVAFPRTGVLDNASRADQGPPPSSDWTTPSAMTGLKVLNQTFGNDVAQGTAGIWNTLFAADQEVYATITTVPGLNQYLTLMVRNQSATAWGDGYYAEFEFTGAGSNGIVRVYRYVSSVATQLGATITLSSPLAAVQQIGVRVVGSTITIWRNGALVDSRTDSNIAGAGRLFVRCSDEVVRFGDFGGGAA